MIRTTLCFIAVKLIFDELWYNFIATKYNFMFIYVLSDYY